MIINWHMHLPAAEAWDAAHPEHAGTPPVDVLLRTMDACGVDRACISSGWPVFAQEEPATFTRILHEHADRLIGFGFLFPGLPDYLRENDARELPPYYRTTVGDGWREHVDAIPDGADRVDWYAEHGYRGIKIQAPGAYLDDDKFLPIYERAAAHRMPVLFHTTMYRDRHGLPAWNYEASPLLERIARRVPEGVFVGAHMGGLIPWHHELAQAVMIARENLYFDTCAQGIPEGVTWHTEALRKMLWGAEGAIVEDRMRVQLGHIERAFDLHRVPEDLRRAIMGGTAARLLGL